MNTGKIIIGFSLVLLSIAMMVSPSAAATPQDCCEAGYGITVPPGETDRPAVMHHGQAEGFIVNEPRTNATYP
ncbi:MAG TPA: hypothetical protein HA272_06700 [Methanoregula sp.]|nr:hypothetical protein [Methanoregula sp.]